MSCPSVFGGSQVFGVAFTGTAVVAANGLAIHPVCCVFLRQDPWIHVTTLVRRKILVPSHVPFSFPSGSPERQVDPRNARLLAT